MFVVLTLVGRDRRCRTCRARWRTRWWPAVRSSSPPLAAGSCKGRAPVAQAARHSHCTAAQTGCSPTTVFSLSVLFSFCLHVWGPLYVTTPTPFSAQTQVPQVRTSNACLLIPSFAATLSHSPRIKLLSPAACCLLLQCEIFDILLHTKHRSCHRWFSTTLLFAFIINRSHIDVYFLSIFHYFLRENIFRKVCLKYSSFIIRKWLKIVGLMEILRHTFVINVLKFQS